MELLRNGRPRVVITGLGAVTPLGPVKALWQGLKAGRSGIRRIRNIVTDHVPVKIGGEVDLDVTGRIDPKEARRMGRSSQFAVVATQMAIEDAGLTLDDIAAEAERIGVIVGSAIGPNEISADSQIKYVESKYRKPNPLSVINCLPNMPAFYVSRFLRAVGPLNAPTTACAAGTQSVGDAAELIRNGRSDMVIAGGVEAVLRDYTLAGFDAMEALASEYNDEPEKASRPFDRLRSGFVFAEGCGILVLESLAHAIKRGARIYAEVLGHASSADAYHIAAPDPEGRGAQRSMRWALEDAHLNTDNIDYINAHGTSTPMNDAMETLAIKKLFGEQAYNIPVSSTKSMIGHALGGSGAIEAIVCALTLDEQVVHPTINYEQPDPECDLDYVPNTAREAQVRYTLSNSFGLGGQNASLVLGSV